MDAYTVKQFCERHSISRATLYNLWRDGIGPKRMEVGKKILISAEAAKAWRKALEEAAAAPK